MKERKKFVFVFVVVVVVVVIFVYLFVVIVIVIVILFVGPPKSIKMKNVSRFIALRVIADDLGSLIVACMEVYRFVRLIVRNDFRNFSSLSTTADIHFFLFHKHAPFLAEAERAQQNLIFEAEMCLKACLLFISK